jgi:hypothetical protein
VPLVVHQKAEQGRTREVGKKRKAISKKCGLKKTKQDGRERRKMQQGHKNNEEMLVSASERASDTNAI